MAHCYFTSSSVCMFHPGHHKLFLFVSLYHMHNCIRRLWFSYHKCTATDADTNNSKSPCQETKISVANAASSAVKCLSGYISSILAKCTALFIIVCYKICACITLAAFSYIFCNRRPRIYQRYELWSI